MLIRREVYFSDKKRDGKKKKDNLSNYEATRYGLGRAALHLLNPLPGAATSSAYTALTADDYADELDEKGLSDEEILKLAKREYKRRGAVVGGAIGAAQGFTGGIPSAALSGGIGALTGMWRGGKVAGERTKERLEKRRLNNS